MTQFDFSRKVALVTGGASGIGASCARQFSASGAKIVIADMNEEAAQRLVTEIGSKGGEALFVKTDVSNADGVQQLIDKTLLQFGRLDFAVNSAGVAGEGNPLADYSIDDWRKVMAINLDGVFFSMRAQIPAMLRSGGGAIVNLSSVMGLVSAPAAPAYVASKHGVIGLTKAAAQAYSAQGVRVNAICPGFVETPMTNDVLTDDIRAQAPTFHPIGRIAQPDEIAAVALFLCSDGASFITGGVYPIDGGYLTN